MTCFGPIRSIHYRLGDATAPATRPAIIAHVCNDIGAWGRGFVLAVSQRWPQVRGAYYQHVRALSPVSALGHTQILPVEPDLWIANMIAQHGIRRDPKGTPPIRYDALRSCLAMVADAARQFHASVHMPRIGCGLAGGQWERVAPIILETLCLAGVPVTVYTLPHDTAP
jgi:O-acetyl-ADP-ribose deacetylase (regulator of RNase III)